MKTDKKSKKSLRNIDVPSFIKWAKTGIILWILIAVCVSSWITGYGGYLSFYEKEEDPLFNKFRSFIYKQKGYQFFVNYTGLNTGYGFFSPNVSSDFVITHKAYKQGKEEMTFSNTMFKTREGAMRFTNINAIYMDKIDSIENDSIQLDSLRSKYLDLILNRMNTEQLKTTEADSINTTLFLYHFPFLKEYPNVQPQFITIENHTKTKASITGT